MDTSETYVKMCEKATEIQEIWEPDENDFHFTKLKKNVILKPNAKIGYIIWLPRQDQLQEMLGGLEQIEDYPFFTLKGVAKIDSMEQLWLAFVMKEKYNKIWDGSEWVKEG